MVGIIATHVSLYAAVYFTIYLVYFSVPVLLHNSVWNILCFCLCENRWVQTIFTLLLWRRFVREKTMTGKSHGLNLSYTVIIVLFSPWIFRNYAIAHKSDPCNEASARILRLQLKGTCWPLWNCLQLDYSCVFLPVTFLLKYFIYIP
mgnify:CR=1 FL=1